MKSVLGKGTLLICAMLIFAGAQPADADIPTVENLFITDVTTVSFSVIWAASEPCTASLEVFDDVDGTIPTPSAVVIPHPVNNGDAAIQLAAENNGVMKVMVTGLTADTTYYFRTMTTSKSTSDVTAYPEAAPFTAITTEVQTTRTSDSGGDILPFSNDVIIEPCYQPDRATPAEGTLLVAAVAGGNYPVSAFVGDGVDLPYALVDLNNIFGRDTNENLDLDEGGSLTLLNFGGTMGYSIIHQYTPQDNSLAEIKTADAGLYEGWNFVSFQAEPAITELTQFFGDEYNDVNAVWAYDSATAQWSKYKEYDPFNTNDLIDMHGLKGYWIDIHGGQEAAVKVYGSLLLNSTISLYSGWNLVGYSALMEVDLMEALTPITGLVDAVWTYAADTGWEKYKTYDPFNTNNLRLLTPGKAYWVMVNADCEWTIEQ
jgi:hypothetical protein